jgi:DNA-binding LacI/PurR family transcriptional regulator
MHPMISILCEFVHYPGAPMREQLISFVRGLIRSGKLVDRQKLPSTQELAKLWSTQPAIVHAAMTALVKEGVVQRLHSRGTFVQASPRQLKVFGVYLAHDIWHEEHGAFSRAVCRSVAAEAADRGMKPEFFVDARAMNRQLSPWKPLVTAIRQGDIQAVLVPWLDAEHELWLAQLSVPVSTLSSTPGCHQVSIDHRQLVDKGMVELARLGCRKVALISVMNAKRLLKRDADATGVDARRHLVECASSHGLELRLPWLVQPEHDDIPEEQAAQFGYQAMRRLWQSPQRPEGLLVFTDIAARGVVTAASELGIKTPEDLKLVLHHNQGLALDCPRASLIECSPTEVARALLDQVVRRYRGETCGPVFVGFAVVRSPSDSRGKGAHSANISASGTVEPRLTSNR